MKLRSISVLFLVVFSTMTLSAQIQLRGIVLDSKHSEPLISAFVQVGENFTVTDFNGQFFIPVSVGDTVKVSYLGYFPKEFIFDGATLEVEIRLQEMSETLETVTVTGSKFKRRLSETTVSVDIMKPDLIKSINSVDAEGVVNKLPGVQVIGGQANIRGGSGFSYGAGSRVMLLLDDIPALQTDAGFANWGDLPVENVGQVEVVKGAASALYGSAALNGIINFRRATPNSTPKTDFFASGTVYLNPKDERMKWWGDTLRYRVMTGVAHMRKIGKLDLSAHGFYTKEESFNQNTFENRGRFGANLKYRINDYLSLGFNSLGNFVHSSDFFLWRNALRGIYRPLSGTISEGHRYRVLFDPFVHYINPYGSSHRFNSRIFLINNENNNNQSNSSQTYFNEYQFQHNFNGSRTVLTAGGVFAVTNSDAELFGNEQFTFTNAATYLQLEKEFGEYLILSAGLRYEYNKQESPEEFMGVLIPGGKVTDGELISRIGFNFKLAEYSNLRLSWGQGYRYPTVTERFISTTFGSFNIVPNPLLMPEFGWSSEIAIKQGFKVNSFEGFLDLSGFISEYDDMIEFTFKDDIFGFQPINIGDTRISGFEFGIVGKFLVGKIPISVLGGYTYISPIYKNFDEDEDLRNNLSTNQNVLKYRSRHTLKMDLQADFKKFSFGVSAQYASHMINIDRRLETPLGQQDLFQIKIFRDLNNDGYVLLDNRLSYKFDFAKLSFIISNVLNQAYTLRPGLLEAPRNVSLRVDKSF